MKDLSIFEVVLIGLFAFFALLAVFFFASGKVGGDNEQSLADTVSNVEIWGIFPERMVEHILINIAQSDSDLFRKINYTEFSREELVTQFVSELASGRAPDLVILDHEEILRQEDRLIRIPYTSFPRENYGNLFVDSSQIFLDDEGLLALPFLVDPLVVYVNKDLQVLNGIRNLPVYWNDLFNLSPAIRLQNEDIDRALINLGGVRNNPNLKFILSTLIQQVGNDIVSRDEDGDIESTLTSTNIDSVEEAINFYAEFSNPLKTIYTWNEGLPEAFTLFLRGRLLFYIGFATEYEDIVFGNPNLNFDVQKMFQISSEVRPSTYTKLYSVAIPRLAQNPGLSLQLASYFVHPDVSLDVSSNFYIPSGHKQINILEDTPNHAQVFIDEVFIGKVWYDKNPERSTEIFFNLMRGVITGAQSIKEALDIASAAIRNIE